MIRFLRFSLRHVPPSARLPRVLVYSYRSWRNSPGNGRVTCRPLACGLLRGLRGLRGGFSNACVCENV